MALLFAFIKSSKLTSSLESFVSSKTTTNTSSSNLIVESATVVSCSFTSIWDNISSDLSEEFLSNSP